MYSVKSKGTVCLLCLKYLFTLVAFESFSGDCLEGGKYGVVLMWGMKKKESETPGHTFLSLWFYSVQLHPTEEPECTYCRVPRDIHHNGWHVYSHISIKERIDITLKHFVQKLKAIPPTLSFISASLPGARLKIVFLWQLSRAAVTWLVICFNASPASSFLWMREPTFA